MRSEKRESLSLTFGSPRFNFVLYVILLWQVYFHITPGMESTVMAMESTASVDPESCEYNPPLSRNDLSDTLALILLEEWF